MVYFNTTNDTCNNIFPVAPQRIKGCIARIGVPDENGPPKSSSESGRRTSSGQKRDDSSTYDITFIVQR